MTQAYAAKRESSLEAVASPSGDDTPLPRSLDCGTDPGGFKVLDASGQALAYVYARERAADAGTTKVLAPTRREQ